MAQKIYRVKLFKRTHDGGPVYGAKSFTDTLDRACERLIKRFGSSAPVQVLGPGCYSIARGDAEMEIVTW